MSAFNSIGSKLILGFATMLLFVSLVGFVSWWGLTNIAATYVETADDNLDGAVYLSNAKNALWELRFGIANYRLFTADGRARILTDQDNWYRAVDENIRSYEAGARGPEELALLAAWRQSYQQYVTARPRFFELVDEGKIEEATQWRAAQTNRHASEAVATIEQLTGLQHQLANAKVQAATTTAYRVEWTLLGTVVLSVVIGLSIIQFVLRRITYRLQTVTQVVEKIISGDLEIQADASSADEIGIFSAAFNTMTSTIRQQTQALAAQVDAAKRAQDEAEAARAAIAAQLATIEEQHAVIREMSVPILPLSDTVLVMPLVGALDHARLEIAQERTLRLLAGSKTRYLILDITGVPLVDTHVAQGLIHIVQAARLLGTEVLLVGIRPEVAQALVELGIQLDDMTTKSTLQSGIAYAMGGI